MSTFDLLQDWKAGDLGHGEAMIHILGHHAFWVPGAVESESFLALVEIAQDLWAKEDPEIANTRWSAVYEQGFLPPHYPVPAIYDESLHGYILSGSSWSDLDWLNAIDYWLTVRPSFDNNA